MNRNIEIKARVLELQALTDRVRDIADHGPEIIEQEDTFFRSAKGRLKFRKFSDSKGELIYYERSDHQGPKECQYFIYPTSKPAEFVEILSRSVGVRGVVIKRRILYTAGQTRIHLDEVKDLGHFMELEVVLRPDQNSQDGERIAKELMRRLKIDESSLIECAYIDLIERRNNKSSKSDEWVSQGRC
jgi:predicted adenylyl cyclase CyaB